MANVPTNPKLYELIVFQAKARFKTYPSPSASHWVHEEYIKKGGQFADSTVESKRQKMIAEAIKRKRLEKASAKSKKKKGDK